MADLQNFDKAVDQVILDSERLHTVVNGDGVTSATAEDGSLLPSIRKAMLDNIYFKTPLIPWTQGGSVREFNQLYLYTDNTGRGSWWYAPSATQSKVVVMGTSPVNDKLWRMYGDGANIADIYAPLNSPILVGNPQSPTALKGDNTHTIANTEFVSGAIADLKAEIGQQPPVNTFDNITVRQLADLNNVNIKGNVKMEGGNNQTFSAPGVAATLASLTLSGTTSRLMFTQVGDNPNNYLVSDVTPFKITTHELVTDLFKTLTGEFGSETATSPGLIVHGDALMDYVHIKGNNTAPVSKPKLLVDGITQVENLVITGQVTGFTGNVDGLDIKPKSVVASTKVTAEDVQVNKTLTVSGKSTVGDLQVNGKLTGVTLDVDGLDIHPKSVTTTGDVIVGGKLNVGGDTSVNNLNVNGTLTGVVFPTPSVDGIDITPKSVNTIDLQVSNSSNLEGTTTIENLVVTGTVTGLPAPTIDGVDIKPKTVAATGNISTTGDVAVGGNLVKVGGGPVSVPSMSSNLIVFPALVEDVTTAQYTMKISNNIQNLTLKAGSITILPPAAFPPGGASFMLYLQQDATGGRVVQWDPKFVSLNSGSINLAPNSISVVQVIYRGVGDLYDKVVTPRP